MARSQNGSKTRRTPTSTALHRAMVSVNSRGIPGKVEACGTERRGEHGTENRSAGRAGIGRRRGRIASEPAHLVTVALPATFGRAALATKGQAAIRPGGGRQGHAAG